VGTRHNVAEVNNRRKKSENVSVAFKDDRYGETVGDAAAGASSSTPTATKRSPGGPGEM
tara:strand:+ start:379 stop:555 length:177 start_codon:yes stop_codon:yes gene_type:complete